MASPQNLYQTPEDSAGESSADEQIPSSGAKKEKKVSCQPCREAKVKCIPATTVTVTATAQGVGGATNAADPAPCTRCLKLERECFYRTHKRGRKPGKIKLQQILRRLELLDRTLGEINELNKEVKDADAESLIDVLRWQLHRSKFFNKGSISSFTTFSVSTPPITNSVGSREQSESIGVGTSGSIGGGGGNKEMTKSRSDFNMLVDLEDHASVARVPDEFPTLSNPLKLLAQASSEESERRRSKPCSLRKDTCHSSDDEPSLPPNKRIRTSPPPCTTIGGEKGEKNEMVSGASGWAKTYFSRGAFHPVYDNRQEFDPIDQGLMTVGQAERLVGDFYGAFGTFMHIFDPTLSTVGYIRKHSAFLLTVMCSLAAEFNAGLSTLRTGDKEEELRKENEGLAIRLRAHYEGMITFLTSGDYKNVEMAQAFYLLASYRDMSESAMSDQTWLFLGTSIRIATELGCNLVCYSYATQGGGEGGREHYQRQLRNTERLWLNLWNLEKTLASQTGQRMHLADEGVIATCSRWYRMPLALKQDEALVAQVELRRLMIGCGEGFNTHVLRALGARRSGHPDTQTRVEERWNGEEEDVLAVAEKDQLSLQLSYFRNSVHMDLKRWEERWLPSHTSHTQVPGGEGEDPTPLQITGPLSLDYAALVTYALPLPISYSVDVTPELTLLWRSCYISCTNYMATFIDRCQRGYMTYVTNSTVVSTVYAVVFALDLARKAKRAELHPGSGSKQKTKEEEGGGRGKGGGVDFGFVSKIRVLNLARSTARELEKIGATRKNADEVASGKRGGRSIATKYSVFLFGVLARFDAGSDVEDAGEGEGEGEREAVKRGGFDANTSRGKEGSGGEARHLRRDHNHPLCHQPPSLAEGGGGGRGVGGSEIAPIRVARLVPGTKASHAYSSNIHFSPPSTQHLPTTSSGGPGWNASAPTPSSAPSSSTSGATWNSSFQQQSRFIPPHHNTQQPQHWQDQSTTGASGMSPASWFNHIQPHPNQAVGGAGAGGQGGGAGLEEDPSWEWMMKDLDFFNVDGGGGEPILDQMGRLFG